MPRFTQICTSVVKYWLCIKSPAFDNTLFGKATDVDLSAKPVSCTAYLLTSCDTKINNFKSFNVPEKELEYFCHYV